MPKPETVAIVKQILPTPQAHGEPLTRHFYNHLFMHNPEVCEYFNPAHQRAGNQQRVLADATARYYFCGPNPMLKHVYQLLKQRYVPDTDIHFELFGTAEALTS